MTYRADPVSQRDGSRLASSNCRMGAGATGLDFETRGGLQETAAELRERQLDQIGGTDSSDLALAWHSYGRTLRIRDGHTFDDALDDLAAGRLVMLDVWHAAAGGPCLSGSGAYGHTLAVAPEQHRRPLARVRSVVPPGRLALVARVARYGQAPRNGALACPFAA